MEYTVKALGKLAHVSPRTLRYYDEIGLLKPKRIGTSGYRIYGSHEVDRLQQILFYKTLGLGLSEILKILDAEGFDSLLALKSHREQLLDEKRRIEALLGTVEKTIEEKEGVRAMKDNEKFEGFMERKIEENETHYGKEIRERYGDEAIDLSNKKLKDMTPKRYARFSALEDEIIEKLKIVTASSDTKSLDAKALAERHKEWITMAWGNYSAEAHRRLVSMYTEDQRFKDYYETRAGKGSVLLLKESVLAFIK